jgi:hypothetical protein
MKFPIWEKFDLRFEIIKGLGKFAGAFSSVSRTISRSEPYTAT